MFICKAKILLNKNGILDKLVALPTLDVRIQLFRYFFAGGIAAVSDWSVYWLLVSAFSINYIVASFFSFIIATALNYIISVRWVFIYRKKHGRIIEIILIYFVSAIGLAINSLCLYLFVEFMFFHLMWAKVAATGVVFLWNFMARKYIIFK